MQRFRIYGLALLLGAMTAAVFWPALDADFIVNYDDRAYVLGNPMVREGVSWQGVRWAFTTGAAANWHPLTWLSHMLDVSLFGLDPRGHHLTSVLLHAINSMLLFLMLVTVACLAKGRDLRRHGDDPEGEYGSRDARPPIAGIFGRWRASVPRAEGLMTHHSPEGRSGMSRAPGQSLLVPLFLAALFAWHPLRVESVAWVAERKDLLCAAFWFLGVGCYLRYGRACGRAGDGDVRHGGVWYGLTLACFVLGLMSKPMMVTFPLVLLLLDVWPLGRMATRRDPDARSGALERMGVDALGRRVLEKMPFLGLGVLGVGVTLWAQGQGGAIQNMQGFPLAVRVQNACLSYGLYLRKGFWPGDLAYYYPHPGSGIVFWHWAGTALVLGLITVCVVAAWRRAPGLAVGWFWFGGTLMPVIGLVQVGGQGHADRYTYIPHVGLVLILLWAAGAIPRRAVGGLRRWRLPVAILGLALLAAAVPRTRSEMRWWRDELTLYGRALALHEAHAFAHFNMGGALLARAEPQRAAEHFRRALELDAGDIDARISLGVALALTGELEAAVGHMRMALAIDPARAQAWNNLGRMLEKADDPRGAAEAYREALRCDPDMAVARANLAALETLERAVPAVEQVTP